jgi:hypothetical protein
MKIFEPMRHEASEQLRISCNEELCDLYSSDSIVGTRVGQSGQ